MGLEEQCSTPETDTKPASPPAKKPDAKRGPKTDPNAPHNAKIREVGAQLVAEGNTIIAAGGVRPEQKIDTFGGVKQGRRPDILYRTPGGEQRAINVGKTMADGTTQCRESVMPWS